MTHKKEKLFTFFFSLFPGAGHFYLGFMKQGISFMLSFSLIWYFTSWANFFGYLIPIIWFYSFFDALNKNSLPDEEFYALEDHYVFPFNNSQNNELEHLFKRKPYWLGFILVIIGISMLFSILYRFLQLYIFIPEWLDYLLYNGRVVQIGFSILIIYIGIKMIIGKKRELEKELLDEEQSKN